MASTIQINEKIHRRSTQNKHIFALVLADHCDGYRRGRDPI